MRWTSPDGDHVVVTVTRQELRMLNNALSESLDRVDNRVFPTLMGATKDEFAALLVDFWELRAEWPT